MEIPRIVCDIVQCEFYYSIKMYLSKKPFERYNPTKDLHRLTTCIWTNCDVDLSKMLQEANNDQDHVITILIKDFLASCKENLQYIHEITTDEMVEKIVSRAENFIHLYVVNNARSQST